MRPILIAITALGVLLSSPGAPACTTFCAAGPAGPVFGRNYDWMVGDGALVVNARGVSKVANLEGNPARWTSRHGSVTFVQYGREFPTGGMNETGLVVELMWLDGSRYPEADGRAELPNLQWIQYLLDTCSTVEEVLATDGRVRITGGVPLHFLVADRSGTAATIEFLDGRMVAHTGERLPVAALANSRYDESLQAWRQGGLPPGPASLSRFGRAADAVRSFSAKDRQEAVTRAFGVLGRLAQGAFTQWSIVYEPAAGRVSFRTQRQPRIRSVDLAGLSFACGRPALGIDLDAPGQGDVTAALRPFGSETNLSLVRRSAAATPFLAALPAAEIEATARYPDGLACAR